MNDSVSSKQLLFPLLVVFLFSLGVLGWLQMLEAVDAHADARRNLQDCQALANEIVELRETAAVATTSMDKDALSNESLRALLTSAQIPETQLNGLERVGRKSVPETEYERDDAIMQLRGLTLKQVCQLLMVIHEAEGSWTATSLHLSWAGGNTPSSNQEERWNVDLGLTHLVYVAKSS